MALYGNKGEWSEIYVLLKLLGEGKIFAGDQNLNKIQSLFYPIVNILRYETKGNQISYGLQNGDVVIQPAGGNESLRIPTRIFLQESESLLAAINRGKATFEVPAVETFMHQIRCNALKAKSTDKTDISIILHDPKTKLNSELGFSIKSQLGGNSTLLNASKATNFAFRICGPSLTDEDIATINAIDSKNKVIDRWQALNDAGCSLKFERLDNKTFRNNLILLDGDMPDIVANLLLANLNTGESNLKILSEHLSFYNPLEYDMSQGIPFYEYKIKHLLASAALGMMPARAWNGLYDANGGYIVVKKDGDVLCYHFYERNRFEDYLFNNAYVERASTGKHEYGTVVREEDNTLIFTLNLQIRMR